MQKGQGWDSVRITTRLTGKYDIHFNFFLTKPVTEMVYNHTAAPATIAFKDAVVFADCNEYLKRYYFLVNALEKEEIYDRINLLAEFYGSAVLLRYEYPLMVLTRTKSIFLKRLKRMKKMLVEEGSSDESKSNREEKAVSINSSQFLQSVSSSELERKSLDDDHRLQLDFSLFRESEYDTYDIFEPPSPEASRQSAQGLIALAQTLTEELVLEREQREEELRHLVVDFDEFDREEVLRRYQRILEKENCHSSKQSTIRRDSVIRSNHSRNPLKIRELMEKKPMASSITITALDEHPDLVPHAPHAPHAPPPHSPAAEHLQKKSMLSPRAAPSQNMMKRSSYYQYEMEHHNFPLSHELVIAEDEMEDSPRHHQMRIKKFPSMDQQDFNSASQQKRQENAGRRAQAEPQTSRDPPRERADRGASYASPLMKYSSILHEDARGLQRPYFEAEQRYSGLPAREFDFKPADKYGQFAEGPRFSGSPPAPNRMTSINININNLEEKKEPHRVNVRLSKQKFAEEEQKYGGERKYGEEFAEEERHYRAEKKKRIREKAAALLNRVKSQEYMRTADPDYDFPADPAYFRQRYY